jgi:hypothetical protein
VGERFKQDFGIPDGDDATVSVEPLDLDLAIAQMKHYIATVAEGLDDSRRNKRYVT